VERAIGRKLKEKKHKSSRYTTQRAKEANEQFNLIDASWIPEGCEDAICSEENIKEILNMIKRHASTYTNQQRDISYLNRNSLSKCCRGICVLQRKGPCSSV